MSETDDLGLRPIDDDEEIEASVVEAIPAAEYPIKVEKIELGDFKFGPAYKFHFKVTEGEYAGTPLDGLATKSGGGKLRAWLEIFRGAPFGNGEPMRVSEAIGRTAVAEVGTKEIKPDDGPAFDVNKIVRIKSPKTRPAPRGPGVADLARRRIDADGAVPRLGRGLEERPAGPAPTTGHGDGVARKPITNSSGDVLPEDENPA